MRFGAIGVPFIGQKWLASSERIQIQYFNDLSLSILFLTTRIFGTCLFSGKAFTFIIIFFGAFQQSIRANITLIKYVAIFL